MNDAEEQAVRRQEEPHQQLPVVQARGRFEVVALRLPLTPPSVGGLNSPAVDADDENRRADRHQRVVVDQADRDEREAERGDERDRTTATAGGCRRVHRRAVVASLRVAVDAAPATSGIDVALLVLAVLLVPEVVAGVDLRDLREVVVRGRRRDRPLERAGVPRVVAATSRRA